MRFQVLACDYDRTIALSGVVAEPARRALRDVRASGRRLVLVTGRTDEELRAVFDELDLFSRVVLENGGVLLDPASGEERLLGARFPQDLSRALQQREVAPLVLGRVICSTAAPNEAMVLEAIVELGLRMQLVLNRDSVMVLPPGVDKASGLRAALAAIGCDAAATVAVGDGENDLALLAAAGAGVAVENAVDELKEKADIVLDAPGIEGIRLLCDSLVGSDLADLLGPAVSRAG